MPLPRSLPWTRPSWLGRKTVQCTRLNTATTVGTITTITTIGTITTVADGGVIAGRHRHSAAPTLPTSKAPGNPGRLHFLLPRCRREMCATTFQPTSPQAVGNSSIASQDRRLVRNRDFARPPGKRRQTAADTKLLCDSLALRHDSSNLLVACLWR